MEKTHAAFRAMRESLGLSQKNVADALGVQQRSVRRWEEPDYYLPPADAWEYLEHMSAVYAKGVAAALSQVADIVGEAGKAPNAIAMTYYRSQQEYDDMGRDEGPYGFRNAMTREVAAKLRAAGYDVTVSFLGEN